MALGRSQSCPELNLEGLGEKEGELRKFLVATPFKNQQDFLGMLKGLSFEQLSVYCTMLEEQFNQKKAQAGGAQVQQGAEGGEPSSDLSLGAQLNLASAELQKREAQLEAQNTPDPYPLSQ
ncbi:hypothetical protein [Piscirickettsia salmonis]|uniref:hypothetical protein n=1 Tax=Piscirickettsia salmonis TaxID=1238 RepID=UPI0007C992A2|nr:hypothetical protein A0O36_02284 [Piscirickettsiaceae bacterium NZ-RLO1]